MRIDIREVPFSRRGSYFAVSLQKESEKLWLRDVSGGDESPSQLFECQLYFQGNQFKIGSEQFNKTFHLSVTETRLLIQHRAVSDCYMQMIFPNKHQMRIKQKGLTIVFVADKVRYDTLNQVNNRQYEYISYKKETKYQLDFASDSIIVDAPWEKVGNSAIHLSLPDNGHEQEMLITAYQVVPSEGWVPFAKAFEEEAELVAEEYQQWSRTTEMQRSPWFASCRLANYILWSSIVGEKGMLTGESIYMSKNWMQNIWSWDNCFNALGVFESDPELAYNQFDLFIRHQDASGAYPDFINNQFKSYNCVKPPVHAWAYQLIKQQSAYFNDSERLLRVYESISRSTMFWLKHRRIGKDGLCYYTHGNDSGWDNASIFHEGLPVASPDLAAYLIQQMDILSDWAKELNNHEDSRFWEQQADHMLKKLLSDLYDQETNQFIARKCFGYQKIMYVDSLILCLPIVIAYRLPDTVKNGLVCQLSERFEGKYGLSTEAVNSVLFDPAGYWLGPIWAPTSYIFFEALQRAGEMDMAQRLAYKFCDLTTVGGMAENYHPQTGQGNDDLSFTWTSSVFLQMHKFLMGSRNIDAEKNS